MVDLTRKFDVLVIGGGNAALCAAISARRAGASVLVLEGAPKFYRGGNTRHTRNMRCAHDAATEILTGPYTEEEFWDDLLRVTGGQTDEELARFMIRESKDILNWIVEQGVRWQPSLGGTLSLGRTNSFFLGGGRAMLNALYLTAETARRRHRLRRRGASISRSRTACSCRPTLKQPIDGATEVRASALVAAAGGFEANIEWLKQYWGEAADNFLIRGTPYNRGTILQDAARPRACRRSAIPPSATRSRSTRARRNSTAASSRGSIAWCSASSSTSTPQRFYDEGEDIWPKRYAIWGRLVAAQPDQIAYIIFDRSRRHQLHAVAVSADRGQTHRRTRRQARTRSGGAREDRHRLQRRGAARHLRSHHPRRLPHRRADAAEDALGAQDRDAAVSTPIRCGPASPSPISAPA